MYITCQAFKQSRSIWTERVGVGGKEIRRFLKEALYAQWRPATEDGSQWRVQMCLPAMLGDAVRGVRVPPEVKQSVVILIDMEWTVLFAP